MASESATEMQSFLERLISSRNRDSSLFIPFLLGFGAAISDSGETRSESAQSETDPYEGSGNNRSPDESNGRDRIILINPVTQGMVVLEGRGLDSLFRMAQEKGGQPPVSKSSVEAMPCVEIKEGEKTECVICLEEFVKEKVVKEMPCQHRFHGECIEKWLGLHGSCPVCRFNMPVEEEEKGSEGGERGVNREIWVSFSFGGRMRRRRESGSDDQGEDDRTAGNESDDHMES